jgi:ribosomal protein L10
LEYHGKNKINGGIYEQKFISGVTLEEWAKLPSKEQLLQTLCYFLQKNLIRLVKLLEKLKEKKALKIS